MKLKQFLALQSPFRDHLAVGSCKLRQVGASCASHVAKVFDHLDNAHRLHAKSVKALCCLDQLCRLKGSSRSVGLQLSDDLRGLLSGASQNLKAFGLAFQGGSITKDLG